MADLSSRLDGLHTTIERPPRAGGPPGPPPAAPPGRPGPAPPPPPGPRDSEESLPVTEETIFPICSLTKALTAAAMGILVEEKKVTWNTLVKDVLPSFHPRDGILHDCLTISDILSHRSGMSWTDNLVIGTENNILIASNDGLKFVNKQTRLLPFRAGFSYNNLQYDLAGYVIEELSGQSWFDFVQSRILDPLGLDRTFLKAPPVGTSDVATCYNARDDATTVPVPCPKAGNDWFAGPSGGARSCVRDLLKLYRAFSNSFKDQLSRGSTSTEGTPFKQVAELTSAKLPMDQPSRNELSYAFGWARAQLPNRMGQIGINTGLMPDGMPVVGKCAPSQLVLFHQGSLPGALSIVMLLPDTDNIILVLSNSLALNDVPV